MQQKNYLQLYEKIDISKILKVFLYILIFLQPFNHFNTLREISFYCLLCFFVLKIFKEKRHIKIDFKDSTIMALGVLVIWSFIVSILGHYPIDSLNSLRKNFLIELLIFFVIISEFKTLQELRTLFLTIIISFFLVTMLSILEKNPSEFFNFLQLNKTHKMFYKGYANHAVFYLPFITVYILSFKEFGWKKYLTICTLSLGILLVFFYNSRTALIAISTALFMIFLLLKRHKILIVGIIIFILFILILISSNSDYLVKYKTLVNPKTYVTNQGLSNRLGVWKGAIDIIKERPLIGYGYGWKKMAWVIKDSNIVEYWQKNRLDSYNYYVIEAHLSYGRVNPHNLILQIMFEIGIIGLIIFLWLWITVIIKIIKLGFLHYNPTIEIRNFAKGSLGILIAYGLINITNGFWQEVYGNLIFLFIASILVIYRQTYTTKNFKYDQKNPLYPS